MTELYRPYRRSNARGASPMGLGVDRQHGPRTERWLRRHHDILDKALEASPSSPADPTALVNPASYSMGSWAVVIGIVSTIAAIRLRQEIRSLWLMGTSGVLLVVFGILMVWPKNFGWWSTGPWVLASGITLIAFAFQARNREKWSSGATTLQG